MFYHAPYYDSRYFLYPYWDTDADIPIVIPIGISNTKESNVRASLKQYIVDSLYTAENIALTFDTGLAKPDLLDHEIVKWVAVQFGGITMDSISRQNIQLFCCTRKDKEGDGITELRDTVLKYMTDQGSDRLIPFLRIDTDPWSEIGALLITLDVESGLIRAEDDSKYKILHFSVIWGARI